MNALNPAHDSLGSSGNCFSADTWPAFLSSCDFSLEGFASRRAMRALIDTHLCKIHISKHIVWRWRLKPRIPVTGLSMSCVLHEGG
jgi:hypothetical protein